MAEWSMAVVLKTTEPATVPGVRIPLPPPNTWPYHDAASGKNEATEPIPTPVNEQTDRGLQPVGGCHEESSSAGTASVDKKGSPWTSLLQHLVVESISPALIFLLQQLIGCVRLTRP